MRSVSAARSSARNTPLLCLPRSYSAWSGVMLRAGRATIHSSRAALTPLMRPTDTLTYCSSDDGFSAKIHSSRTPSTAWSAISGA